MCSVEVCWQLDGCLWATCTKNVHTLGANIRRGFVSLHSHVASKKNDIHEWETLAGLAGALDLDKPSTNISKKMSHATGGRVLYLNQV